MSRYLARLTLLLLAAGACYGLWLLRIRLTAHFFGSNDPRVLFFLGGLVALVGGGIAAVVAVIYLVLTLWELAFPGDRT